MKCLVIAAGKGDRLVGKVGSKPLVSLLGLSLIARVILTCRKAGIDDFIVITGYKSKELQDFLAKLSNDRDINITCIYNDEWEKENGLSVLKAKDLLNDNFMLTMSDHIIEVDILKRLMDEPIEEDEVVLAVDYNTGSNSLVDVDDVTKVLIDDEHITGIGKNITEYNAYDTGIFLCTPAIFSAIERNIAENSDTTLSGGIRTLAAEEKAKVFDIKDGFWIDVDDVKALRRAKKLLYDRLIKPADGFVSRYINRRFSIKVFTPLFLKIYKGITPNQVSILSFIVSLISSLCFFLGHPIIGALLIQLASVLDGSDGEIARLKHMQSSLGDFVDAVLDRYADGFVLLGIFYYSLVEVGNKEALGIYWNPFVICTISVLAILGNLMVSYTSAKSVANFGYRYKGRWIAAGRGRDLRLFLVSIGGIMTFFHPVFAFFALCIIAVQTNIIAIWRTIISWNFSTKEGILSMMERIKAVIFDFDGTVANTMPFLTDLAVKLITVNYNVSKEEAKKTYLETTGMDFASQLESIFPNHPSNQEVAAVFEERKLESIFDHPVFPEAISTLRYFRNKKIKTFICSSTKQEIVAKYSEVNKIDVLIDGLFGYKPNFKKGEQIDFILRHCKIQPGEVLFVGDSLEDYDFVKNKGIRFISLSRIFGKGKFREKGILSVSCLKGLIKLFEKSEKSFKSLEKVN